MLPDEGSQAPDFTLRDSNRQQVSLSRYRGVRPVLLVFYPFAFSGTCQAELDALQTDLDRYEKADVAVLAISVDTPYSLKAWSRAQGYRFPLLSDFWPHGAVAKSYGTFNPTNGMSNRGTFLVDPHGTIRYAEVNEPGEPRDQTAWQHAVAALTA
ncbi:peroxiredoxin [Umezawaea tangerina]|uniref:Alkyl hydroperoxide reductase E n=1 Tax=Umezawaea tangerina TaxID=84725 RepID=A0A2T0SKY9_9PSEU|nr:peroxiredoxin [Umezawaea tangerina]PRY34081.1 peroxiredoxin (alkyl hydroperoxide reductase subunit C) [Umezawaea tangerina]